MKATFHGAYSKRNANTGKVSKVFRFKLSGTPEELAAYKADQGANYREDEVTKEPFFFTVRPAGKSFDVVKTRNSGQYVANSSEMDLAAAVASQYGGNLGQELARASVSQLLFGGTVTPAPVAVEAGADLNQG